MQEDPVGLTMTPPNTFIASTPNSRSVQLRDGCAAISINEPDFTATFDHHSRTWTASWKWSEDHAPERLHNKVSEYPVAAEI